MVNEIKNKFIINAPAGSGKTTSIKNRIYDICTRNPKDKILCITYTNRAVEELSNKIDNPNVEVFTIHSYINKLISPFFKEKEVIEFYFTLFEKKINERIKNEKNDELIKLGNDKYCEKYDIEFLNYESIKNNLKEISYGELPFTSYYYGKLSHDDLIKFAVELCNKYPIMLQKIYNKYKYVFIDEYQDTPTDILKIFNNAANKSKTMKLYLLGDRMQQIYPNYDGSFETEFALYDNSEKLQINYRSVQQIVDILNNIYNNENFNQESGVNNNIEPDINPMIIFSNDQEKTVLHLENKYKNSLKLYLMNKEKYNEIGSINLYNAYDKMEMYSYGKKYKANDILTDMSNENHDYLISCLILLYEIIDNYKKYNYGFILHLFKNETKFLNKGALKLEKNSDKVKIKDILQICLEESTKENAAIIDILTTFNQNNLIGNSVLENIKSIKDYEMVLNVKFKEFCNIIEFLKNPNISTQHGVKGESHDSVIFIANDCKKNPNVRMYDFFELFSVLDFSMQELENFYYVFRNDVIIFLKDKPFSHSNLIKEQLNDYGEVIKKYCENMYCKYKDNKFFKVLYVNDFKTCLEKKQTISVVKKILSYGLIEGILFAYKIFYVGCSRAKRNLMVVVNQEKIEKYKETMETKFKKIGFEIEND